MDNGEVFAIDVLNWATRYVGRNILYIITLLS